LSYLFLTYLEFGGLSSCGVLGYLVSSPVINIRMPEGVNSDYYWHYQTDRVFGLSNSYSLQIRWLGLLLFAFRLSKPHPDCVEATVGVACNLKFHFLPFSKGTIVHPLKLVAAKEELFFPFCLDEPKTTVCN
jgi:hypothetical protein